MLNFPGLKVTCCDDNKEKPGVKTIKRRNTPWGIQRHPHLLAWNLSSGGAAINLAVHFGVKRIILLGYDMRKIDGRCNWHQDHEDVEHPRKDPYERFMRPFPSIAKDLIGIGVECLNATKDSALQVFKKARLEDVL